ncbi:MAG TPA: 2'-5' RNA ligase family protein, partial [Jiangellaceae bacterium]
RVEQQIEAEREQERQQSEAERTEAEEERDARTARREAEDAERQTRRAEEDIRLAGQARTAAESRRALAKLERDRERLAKDRERLTRDLERMRAERARYAESGSDRVVLYDDSIAKAEAAIADADTSLAKIGEAETKLREAGVASQEEMQELRDRVRLSRVTEDIERRSGRQAEDLAARSTSRALRDRIAARKREMASRHKELRKSVRGSLEELRDQRRRMLVRAALTTDLHERAVLQASAAALTVDIATLRAGDSLRPLLASAGFDGAAIVLLADEGTVDYPDGTSSPLHVTLAYLGPADQMSWIERDAAVQATKRVANQFDPFTPTALSPARFGDTDVLLVEHPNIQRGHDVAMADRTVARLNAQHDEHPHFVPHCSGADEPPRLDRAALMFGGEQDEFPLGRSEREEPPYP